MTNHPMNQVIDPADFCCDAFTIWGDGWFLLAGGDFEQGQYNAMTVGWGFFGTMWAKPAVMAVVRPQRHTLGFLDEGRDFTLSAFSEEHRDALMLLGRNSGKIMPDKISRSGLTPVAASKVAAPAFAEAELTLECRKLYRSSFAGRNFCDKSLVSKNYPDGDYHICFIAEVLRITGSDRFRKN